MRRLFKKAMGDIWDDRRRAITSMLAILLGLLSFGITMFSHFVISRELVSVYDSINPASATIIVDNADEKLRGLTADFDGISQFEIKAAYSFRVLTPSGDTKHLELFAVEDFENTQLNQLAHESGATSPNQNEALIERDAIKVADVSAGDMLTILLPDGKEVSVEISGTVADIGLHPATAHDSVYLYVSYATLAQWGLTPNKIDYIVSGESYNREHIASINTQYTKILIDNGYQITSLDIPKTPGISMHLEEYRAALFLLQVFAFVSFLFGSMIMGNLISTILLSQTRQIGILKAIGAGANKISWAYRLAMLTFTAGIALVSFVLVHMFTIGISGFLLSFGNMHIENPSIPVGLSALFIILALVVPVIISIIPIRRGINITIKDALYDTGIKMNERSHNLPLPKFISRPIILSLRNALRKRKRFLLNVSILALSGAVFVSIAVSFFTIQAMIAETMGAQKFDYHIVTTHIKDEAEFEKKLVDMPYLEKFEIWDSSLATLVNENAEIGNTFPILAPTEQSTLFEPILISGRWVNKTAPNEIVVTHKFFENAPNYELGDTIALQINGRKQDFVLVGVVKDLGSATLFMSKPAFDAFVPMNYRISNVKFDLQLPGFGRQSDVYDAVEDYLIGQNISILQSQSKRDIRSIVTGHFTVTVQTFLFVAVLLLIVSGFGLSATMSAQTTERTKEIGVMKAMGASRKQIINIVTAESRFISLSAWFVSIFLGVPLGIIAVKIFETQLIETPLNLNLFAFVLSFILWLAFTFIIGTLASKGTAKRAVGVTIRKALSIE